MGKEAGVFFWPMYNPVTSCKASSLGVTDETGMYVYVSGNCVCVSGKCVYVSGRCVYVINSKA